MDVLQVFQVAFYCALVAGWPSATHTNDIQQEDIEALLAKERESEAVPPVELSKEVTFIHSYNDTDPNEGDQHVYSNINPLGGLENRLQNLGGIQKTILNNKIQYNFYFWLVPKNVRSPEQKHENL